MVMRNMLKILIVILFALGCPQPSLAQGVIGSTCSAALYCPKSNNDSTNACLGIGKKFYPGVLMLVAKSAFVKECQRKNALDYCGAFGGSSNLRKEYGGGCAEQCKSRVVCLHGDNR